MLEPKPSSVRRVLFVDDEVSVLHALRRLLRDMRYEWQTQFASDVRDALEALEKQEFDALVTDMRMPQMDGAELLERARNVQPAMARIVLSGFSERVATVRSVGLAHQFLAKPCNSAVLRATVYRACELRSLLSEQEMIAAVCGLGSLPSLPKLYDAIVEEASRDVVSLARIARIVEQDVSMTAKVLQVVNSSFFGLGRRVLDVEQAINCLGIDVIRALLSNDAFSAFENEDVASFEPLWRHSSLTGLLARRIAVLESGDALLHGEAYQAGVLHDIGRLILANRMPRHFESMRPAADAPHASSARDRALLGSAHGRIGAYLMGLWGLSDRIVEALAYHHEPARCAFRGMSPLTLVHAADAVLHEQLGNDPDGTALDVGYLAEAGCSAARIDEWRRAAERTLRENDGRQ